MVWDLADIMLRDYEFVDLSSPVPIWFQIVRGFEELILARKLKPEEYLPSISRMARFNGIHPSTVARSYKILVKKGRIAPDSTRGYRALFFVDEPPAGSGSKLTIKSGMAE